MATHNVCFTSNGILHASGRPVQSMNVDALYTNQFLPSSTFPFTASAVAAYLPQLL
jgi:hypothetical protein